MSPAFWDRLVGRSADLAHLTALVTGTARLVTLTGPGGVGKTRVAVQLAADLRRDAVFRDGVVLVDLRAMDNPEWIAELIAQSIGVQTVSPDVDALTTLQSRLRGAEMLLVLDNCEQFAAELADVAAMLLGTCPRLRVLATSRATLELPGEHQYPLPPLSAPHPDSPEHRSEVLPDALVLFAERARAVDPAFDLEREHAAVARICHRLGGFPLLIEIITSKLRMFSVPQLEQRIDEAFGTRWSSVTRTGYRTTFRKAMDLSWRLCTTGEQQAWQRLSVFADGIPLDGAEAVLDDGEDVEQLLEGLIRQSLLVRDTDSRRPRFVMLEPIRQVGAAALAAAGETELARERHSAWTERFLADAAHSWCGPEESLWFAAVSTELPNVRHALEWCTTSGNSARGIRILTDLFRTCEPFRSWTMREWREHLNRMIDIHPQDDQWRALGLATSAWTAMNHGGPETGTLLERAARIVGSADDARLSNARAVYAIFTLGDPSAGPPLATIHRLLREQDGADGDIATATMWCSVGSALFADLGEADEATRAFLADATRYGSPWLISAAQWSRAAYLLRAGAFDEAVGLLRDSLSAQRAIGDRYGPIGGVGLAGWLTAARGNHVLAAELMGAGERIPVITGYQLGNVGVFGDAHRECQAGLLAALGPTTYQAAYERGLAVPDLDAAIGLALKALDQAPEQRARLTPREYEIALLVTTHTNAEIAEALFISVSTVRSHVSAILQKLGCRYRREIPAALARPS